MSQNTETTNEIVKPEIALTQNQIDNITLYRVSRNDGESGYEVMTPDADYSIKWMSKEDAETLIGDSWVKVSKADFENEEKIRNQNRYLFNRKLNEYNSTMSNIRQTVLESILTIGESVNIDKPRKYDYNLENLEDIQRYAKDLQEYEESVSKHKKRANEVKTQDEININAADAFNFNRGMFVNHLFYGADGFIYHPVKLHNNPENYSICMLRLTSTYIPVDFVYVAFDFALTAKLNDVKISLDYYYSDKKVVINFGNFEAVISCASRYITENENPRLGFSFENTLDYRWLYADKMEAFDKVYALAKTYSVYFDNHFDGLDFVPLNEQ